ncbi:MAG TPA: DUF1049 domain-containing protein [Rhodospirillaceae bacterium]|nr:hypothetical protein [Candidatus Neomarinimicrobiota bacterium]HCX14792.1 DUF1049 domain-containing protein [Rhodospirillaceae bacterium]|tara:strand:+ start:252 stop:542 length:291 start_codon:yes stop_codon:yes gene_type:complete
MNTFIAALVAVLVVLFAVSNRTQVTMQVWPLSYQISMGLYAVILWAVFIGLIIGLIIAWVMGSSRRRELREIRRRVRDLEQSLSRTQSLSTKPSGG